MSESILLNLPTASLDLLRGDRRARLITWLERWGHHAILLGYVDTWLDAQPESVTLREMRARALVALGRADEALIMLDALDAERPRTQTRWLTRLHALKMAGDHAALLALAPEPDEETELDVSAWLRYGDVCRAAGKPDEAADAYGRVAELAPESTAPLRRLAELALESGDAAAARGHIETLLVRNAERRPTVEELRLLRAACDALEDRAAVHSLDDQIARREAEDRAALEAEFGPKQDEPDEPLPAPPLPSLAMERGPGGEVSQVSLPPQAYTLLNDEFGLRDFRPNQVQVIGNVLAGQSTLAIMPTGAGKSLTYQLPAMLLPKATLVVSPLIALMKDQIDGLPDALRGHATAINSSMSLTEVRERMRGIAAGEYKLVYIAPERLRQRPFLHALKRAGVSLFVVDEAHCVSMWGLSFRPDYLFIRAALDDLGDPPVLALTATASVETQAEIQERLGPMAQVTASVFRPNLHFAVHRAGNREEKIAAVIAHCREIAGPIIVYARSRDACEELAGRLRRGGVRAEHYHAQVPDRSAVQERFMRGETRVLVATVAFGMGIDKADVRAIIHYNLPQSVEAYYQEAGRAGRDGQPARCILLYAAADKAQLSTWLKQEAIGKDDLRQFYRTLHAMVSGRYGIVSLETLQRMADRDDETFVRVGVSMLERVGLIRRHFDLPRGATITLLSDSDPVISQFVRASGLRAGQTADLNLIDLAGALDMEPSALESSLLAWADANLIHYTGTGRDPLIEFLPAPPNVGERIDTLLADYQARQDQRIEAMAAYAKGAICRHRAIAAHFGQRMARCGTACDICVPEERQRAVASARTRHIVPLRTDDERPDALRILMGLAALPYPMGRRKVARVLTGASSSPFGEERCAEFGALQHLTIKNLEDVIEQLIADGLIGREAQGEFPVLTLTPRGRRAIDDPDLLPAWSQPRNAPAAETAVEDDEIVARLRSWRYEKATDAGVPAFQILWNTTLEALAAARPDTLDALRYVKGIGPKFVEIYGEELLTVLA
ncbi:MAG: RecQ family ATP-dependent DNA helicase [Thermomicrobiales bacterium]